MTAIRERHTPQDGGAAQLKIPPLTPGGVQKPLPLAEDSEPLTSCMPRFPYCLLALPRSTGLLRAQISISPCPSTTLPAPAAPIEYKPFPSPSPPPRMSCREPQLLRISPIHPWCPPPHGSALFCLLLMGVTIYIFWRQATTQKNPMHQHGNSMQVSRFVFKVNKNPRTRQKHTLVDRASPKS